MLLTKFFLPEQRPGRVNRPRLLDRVNRAGMGKILIVSAPAGFGKTTLVSEWMHETGVKAAWLSLDENDNDPARFWTGLVMAVDGLFPGVGDNCRRLLIDVLALPVQALLTQLLNDLLPYFEGNTAGVQPVYLALDDTHRVTSAAIYEGLLFFIERLPPGFCLVLIGRSDPPLPLGRLRASGCLIEIRAADLRFTLEESAAFLGQVLGYSLPDRYVRRLAERTEGWAVGLQLAGLAILSLDGEQQPGDLDAFIENFSGDDRFVLDYLIEEVLSRLPEAVQSFLLATSILDRMCGPLCDALWGGGQMGGASQWMLERLERENLFLVHLDNRRQWYRYHHLFADLLRHQFERQAGAGKNISAAELHRRAANWLAANDLLSEAIDHALLARDNERAAEWIESCAWNAIHCGEYTTLKEWAEALPEPVLYSHAPLLMHYAWALSYLGDVSGYERPLAAAERLWRSQGDLARLGEALNLRADFAATYGDGKSAAELAQQALDLLPSEDDYHRGMSWLYLGGGALLQGRLEDAHQAALTSRNLCQRSGNTTGQRMAANFLAQIDLLRADLPAADLLLEETLRQIGNLPIYEGLAAQMMRASIWREWNRIEDARQMLRRVLEAAESMGQAIYFNQIYINLALIEWELGNPAGVQAALDRQAQLAEQMNDGVGQKAGAAGRALLAILSGDLSTARVWQIHQDGLDFTAPDPQDEFRCLTLARLLVRQGEVETRQALILLAKLDEAAAAQGRLASRIEICIIKALGLSRLNDLSGALDALHEALCLGLPGGYLRTFIDEGPLFFDLLRLYIRRAAPKNELREYAARLISLASAGSEHPLPDANRALIEPLTPREVEVLGLIQAGLSNQQIATQLFLSLNTVKVHVKNIFAKLEVDSRTQAVHRAIDLGLI
jgi:LuxR family maltose regulon positive regulatory protein